MCFSQSSDGLRTFGQAVASSRLTDLSFNSNELPPQAIAELLQGFSEPTGNATTAGHCLERLQFSAVPLGDEGARYLADFLGSPQCSRNISKVTINQSKIKLDGLRALALAIEAGNFKLEDITLSPSDVFDAAKEGDEPPHQPGIQDLPMPFLPPTIAEGILANLRRLQRGGAAGENAAAMDPENDPMMAAAKDALAELKQLQAASGWKLRFEELEDEKEVVVEEKEMDWEDEPMEEVTKGKGKGKGKSKSRGKAPAKSTKFAIATTASATAITEVASAAAVATISDASAAAIADTAHDVPASSATEDDCKMSLIKASAILDLQRRLQERPKFNRIRAACTRVPPAAFLQENLPKQLVTFGDCCPVAYEPWFEAQTKQMAWRQAGDITIRKHLALRMMHSMLFNTSRNIMLEEEMRKVVKVIPVARIVLLAEEGYADRSPGNLSVQRWKKARTKKGSSVAFVTATATETSSSSKRAPTSTEPVESFPILKLPVEVRLHVLRAIMPHPDLLSVSQWNRVFAHAGDRKTIGAKGRATALWEASRDAHKHASGLQEPGPGHPGQSQWFEQTLEQDIKRAGGKRKWEKAIWDTAYEEYLLDELSIGTWEFMN